MNVVVMLDKIQQSQTTEITVKALLLRLFIIKY